MLKDTTGRVLYLGFDDHIHVQRAVVSSFNGLEELISVGRVGRPCLGQLNLGLWVVEERLVLVLRTIVGL